MKIAQIVRSMEFGGLERLAVDLALTQKEAGHYPSIYCVFLKGPLGEEAERRGIPVYNFGKSNGYSPTVSLNILQQLLYDKPTVVHTHNELIHHYGTIPARLAGVPIVVNTIHGTKLSLDRKLERNYRAVLPWTDAVVTVSEETRKSFSLAQGRYSDRFHVIRNGISMDRFAGSRNEPGSRWPIVRFGTVGRLVEVKDQATIINAFSTMEKRYPGVELHFLGDGSLLSDLKQLVIKLGLQQKVFFHGASSKVPEFLSTLDVFVLSSLREGLPLVVLEAMATGLPIVSTRVGGIPEVAPEDSVALYCEPGRPIELAQLLEAMLDPVRLRSMGQNAKRLASVSFSIEAMWEQYKALFEELLRKKRSWLGGLLPR